METTQLKTKEIRIFCRNRSHANKHLLNLRDFFTFVGCIYAPAMSGEYVFKVGEEVDWTLERRWERYCKWMRNYGNTLDI